MPAKKDDTGRRWVELEFLVPGTPEQVWQAIATGPGMSAWFTPTTVDERVGGAINFDFGGDDCGAAGSSGTVTVWEPPSRFGYEETDWSSAGSTSAPPLATEVVVTSRSGDQCTVRMVHSLFTGTADWDDELESFESGWPGFIEVLRVYLKNFPGAPAATVRTMAAESGDDELRTWSRLTAALNLGGANVGERRETPPGTPRLAGVVERVRQDAGCREVTLRLDEPAEGVAVIGSYRMGDAARAALSIFYYGAGAQHTASTEQARWAPWLAEIVSEP